MKEKTSLRNTLKYEGKKKKKEKEKEKEKKEFVEKEEKEFVEKGKKANQDNATNFTLLWESIKKNYIFFFVVCFCLYKFKQNKKYTSSYIQLFLSFLAITWIGHFAHFASHNIHFLEIYKKSGSLFTQNKVIDSVATNILSFLDFHDTTHHDSSINKEWKNIFYEFVNNLITQGIGLILFIKFIDIRVVILWAFMYATVHNINYLFIKPSTHQDHHFYPNTNYGIDFSDIIFNTKHNVHDIEEHNHAAFNLLVIVYIISYFTE